MKRFVAVVLVVGGMAVGLSQGTPAAAPSPQQASRSTAGGHGESIGVDAHGVPLLSAPTVIVEPGAVPAALALNAPLPAGTRGWEAIPGVIRTNGQEAFRLEVETNGPVARVALDDILYLLVSDGATPGELRDDGLGGDRVAGDFIFTSVEFRYNTAIAYPFPNYWNNPDSPAGLDWQPVGTVNIHELDGTVTQFVTAPSIAFVQGSVPDTVRTTLAPDVLVSPHVINVSTEGRATQRFIRGLVSDTPSLTQRVYSVLPDDFDFFILFSADKIERVPALSGQNFFAGVHSVVQVNYSGTGLTPFDSSALFGSRGRLLGMSVLDAYQRGLISNNVTHELLHQWSSFTRDLNDGTSHYDVRTSVGSLLGGLKWIDNGNGTFTVNCNEGRGGAHRAAPLDLYMLGLIDASAVAPIHRARPTVDILGAKCAGEPLTLAEIERTVTVADIQAAHGPRQPGFPNAKKDYRVAFLIESRGRLLNATEMTFYEGMAAHYTKPIPAQDPDPYLSSGNWVPVTRYFGEGTTWRSDVWQASQPPTITSLGATPSRLWPPNKKMVPVSVAVAASDGSTVPPVCQVTSVESNEPIPVAGKADWNITGPLSLLLRAERAGSGRGRVYTITVTCTNAAGLSAAGTTMVKVPHDQSGT